MLDNRGTKVDIDATISIRFAGGCLASVACAGNARGPIESRLTLYGTKGTASTGAWGGALEHIDETHQRVRYPYMPYATVSPHRNFVDAMLGHDTLRCPGRYGVRLAELMEAVGESARTGRGVEVRSQT
jgi:predicted dehydrogenase